MSGLKFGTDGVRGVANTELTPEFALRLGLSAGAWLAASGMPRRIAIGRDTRQSGPMLEAALAAGFASVGVEVARLGVVPTPTVAFVARHRGFGMGAVISASHNPAPDNGIKFFSSLGAKLTDEAEAAIEAGIGRLPIDRPIGSGVGQIHADAADVEHYIDFLTELLPEGLRGIKVAVDSANGAAYVIAAEVLRRRGALVFETGAEPNGSNINAEGGATKPETICNFTKLQGADFGVAFDGDADRAIFSDSEGNLVNGDRTMGIWAAYYHGRGELQPPVVVGTVMSNGGFEKYLADAGIKLLRTPVGDKYVSRELEASGSLIGGEQSGHLIFPRHAPSGDGLLTMLELLRVVKLSGKPLTEWRRAYEPWPQLLLNLTVRNPKEWEANARVSEAVQTATALVRGKGRVNVRPSGTQPMLRVMVEAETYELRDAAAAQILEAMQAELGARVYSEVDLTHALGD